MVPSSKVGTLRVTAPAGKSRVVIPQSKVADPLPPTPVPSSCKGSRECTVTLDQYHEGIRIGSYVLREWSGTSLVKSIGSYTSSEGGGLISDV